MLILLVTAVLGLLWLNGPGLRWLGPMVAARLLEKSGLTGSMRVEGSFTGGLTLVDVDLRGKEGALARLTADRVTVTYQPREVVKGRITGIRASGVHVDLRVGQEKDEEKPPLNLENLPRLLRVVRSHVIPAALDLSDFSLAATNPEGETVFQLAPSELTHAAGSSEILLELSGASVRGGMELEPQTATLLWEENRLSLDKLDPYPGIGVRDVIVDLPQTGKPDVSASLSYREAVFSLQTSGGMSGLLLDLRSGGLDLAELLGSFGMDVPVEGKLTSLGVEVSDFLPDAGTPTGRVELALDGVAWDVWSAPELVIAATLEEGRATLALRGRTLDTPVTLDAEMPLTRNEAGWSFGTATGSLAVEDVQRLIPALADRVDGIKAEPLVPESSLGGTFSVEFDERVPRVVVAGVFLKPADDTVAGAVTLAGKWTRGGEVTAEISTDGLSGSAVYEPDTRKYSGRFAADSFRSARIEPWLAPFGVDLGGRLALTGRWSGRGELNDVKHDGELLLERAVWTVEDTPAVEASGEVRYEWPGSVKVADLTLTAEDQKITLQAELADGLLKLERLLWRDGEEEIASGSGSLPVPEDFTKWRETLAEDKRPLDLTLESRELPLSKLKPWLPAAADLDVRSSGKLRLNLSGSYAEPAVDAALDLRNLRVPENDNIPPADIELVLKSVDGRLALDGTITAPDFPPATLKADMAFRPAAWAEEPGSILEEELDARLDIPRLDLSRFAALIPAADKLSGIATGNIVVRGKLGEPDIAGSLELANGGLVFKDDELPEIAGVNAAIDARPDRIVLKSLGTSVAGGTLRGEGSLTLDNGKPGVLDIRLRGDHLPIIRNHVMIVRANADLRVQGPWRTAAITGNLGVVDSMFYRDIEILPIGTPFTGPSAAELPKIDTPSNPTAAIPEPFNDWGVNVRIRTEDPFLIRGNLANGRVDADVRMGGTLGNLAPDGTVRITEGIASLPFSRLSVRRGTLTYTPANGFDPALEIRGYANPRPYRVDVYAYGRLSDPQLVLTSNPPLPENEIMTLLATGTTTSGLEDPQAASSRALQLLAEEIRRGRVPFSRHLRPLLGVLDRVDFTLSEADPYSNDSYSTATLALTDHWYLSAGMGEEGNTRILALWRITFR